MALFKFRRIAAKRFDETEVKRLIRNAVFRVGRGVKKDFESTTQTWGTRPEFKLTTSVTRDNLHFDVSTNSQIYGWVDQGTRNDGTEAYPIAARNKKFLSYQVDFTPKTSKGVIGSQQGGKSGNFINPVKSVYHPGIKARKFSETIRKKWARQFRDEIRQAIHEGLALSGHLIK